MISTKVNSSLSDFWLKIGASIVVFFTPVQNTIIGVVVLIIADAVTGIIASRKRGEKFSSSKLSRSLVKLLFYTLLIGISHVVEEQLVSEIPFVQVSVYFIVFYEFSSFLENIGVITGRDVFSWFRDVLDRMKPGSNGQKEEGKTEPKDNSEDGG